MATIQKEEIVKARQKQKCDTAENWAKASTFIPLKGEIIFYQEENAPEDLRWKVGDGVTKLSELPFVAGGGETLTVGKDSVAGSKGFRYLERINNGTTSTSFVLSSEADGIFAVGTICDIITNSDHRDKAVTQVQKNEAGQVIITFSGTFADDPAEGWEEDAPYKKTIQIVVRPDLGDTDIGLYTLAQGVEASAEGYASTALGRGTVARGAYSVAEGRDTVAYYGSHASGRNTKALGNLSIADGQDTQALADYSHASGKGTKTARSAQTVVGTYNIDDARGLFIVGSGNSDTDRKNSFTVTDRANIIIGSNTIATEGKLNGEVTAVAGSVAEGNGTYIGALYAHSAGLGSQALGNYTFAAGDHTKATGNKQMTVGHYNATDNNAYFIVGNGTSEDDRSNIFVAQKEKVIVSGGLIVEQGINLTGDAKLYINGEDVMGDISTALDAILTIQNSLIGGNV